MAGEFSCKSGSNKDCESKWPQNLVAEMCVMREGGRFNREPLQAPEQQPP
jgi:hypothetical protein